MNKNRKNQQKEDYNKKNILKVMKKINHKRVKVRNLKKII